MRKALAPFVAALTLAAAIFIIACEDEDVGVPCNVTAAATADGGSTGASQVDPQSMECRSRLCLLYGGTSEKAMCTKICDDDDDCPDSTDTCTEGFTCIYALEATKLACCKMCVCRKSVVGNDAGAAISSYCEQNPNQNCPNL